MTINIGNSTLPGVYTRQESNSSVAANVSAPADVGLVGEADLTAGTAEANTVYAVTTSPQAYRLFGDSPLAGAIADALQNGGYPIYSVACELIDVTGEDISGSGSTSVTLSNAPLSEDVSMISIEVDGTSKSVTGTFGNPADESPGSDAAVVNTVVGEIELDAAPSTSGTADYTYADYSGALSALADDKKHVLDFVGVLAENGDVINELNTTINGMANTYNFALGIAGAAAYIPDTSAFTNPLDTSRMQLVFPNRNRAGESLIGAYVGVRGSIGINQSGMRKRLAGQSSLFEDLSSTQKADLDVLNIVVLETDRNGVRMVNDPTCVAADNLEEAEYNHGLARLVGDYVTLIVHDNADRFIGKLHTQSARNNLGDILNNELSSLLRTNSIVAYTVAVEEIDSVTARVEVGIQTADPLRNIEAIIVSGDVDTASA
ncbi:hypothetical protein [Halobellus limi]|uniref:Phage tail sheath protein n=1 Tax=Halobellus limi TaxID=699433 RepID=A0A1H5ZKW0_9EURY|nr:hypothetical protein [Halobellus limi]QCC48086.1 hypothetical protein DV707_10680 [Halobellus limi]SEG36006.1 Phage tail sheath protein [Halobellus limi]